MQPGDLRFRKSMEMMSDGSEIALGVRFLCLIRSLKARTIGLSVLGSSGHRATQGDTGPGRQTCFSGNMERYYRGRAAGTPSKSLSLCSCCRYPVVGFDKGLQLCCQSV